MSMGVHHPYHLDLCAYDEDPSQLIIRPGWDAPHIRCFPRTFCAWPCLLRQVATILGSPCDCIVTGITYANPGSRSGGDPLGSQKGAWRPPLGRARPPPACLVALLGAPS